MHSLNNLNEFIYNNDNEETFLREISLSELSFLSAKPRKPAFFTPRNF